jgi:hypothetical protein
MAEAMTQKDYGDGLTSEEVSYMKGKERRSWIERRKLLLAVLLE